MNNIYLLQVYTSLPDKIYKLGKTKRDFISRYNEYKNSNVEPKIIFVINFLDCDKAEKELLIIFKETFLNAKGFGTEYFKGDVNLMILKLLEYYNKNIKQDVEPEIKQDIEPEIKQHKIEQYIEDIIEPFIDEIQDKTDEIEILNLKLQQAEAKRYLRTNINLNEITNNIINDFKKFISIEDIALKYKDEGISVYVVKKIIKDNNLIRKKASKILRILGENT